MNTSQIIFGTFITLLISMYPNLALGYFTTSQLAKKIDDTHALFIIEYAFGLKKDDMFIPGVSERGLIWGSKEKKVGYTLRNGDDAVMTNGKMTSAVISKAPAVDGMYKLENGKAQKMWLIAILETEKNANVSDYKLQVDSLPFYVDTGKKDLDARQLNPSELKYYVSPKVQLNKGL